MNSFRRATVCGRVEVDTYIRLRSRSRSGQFSTSSFSSLSFSFTPTRSGTLCSEITQNFLPFSSANISWGIVRVLLFPGLARVVTTFKPSTFPLVLARDQGIQFITEPIVRALQSNGKCVVNMDNRGDCHMSFLDQSKYARMSQTLLKAYYSVFKHNVRCACHELEVCFNPYRLLFNHTILPDEYYIPSTSA